MADERKGRLHVWQAQDGSWWWNMAASNGKVFVTSDKGYSSKRNALLAANKLLETLLQVKFDAVDEYGYKITTV